MKIQYDTELTITYIQTTSFVRVFIRMYVYI